MNKIYILLASSFLCFSAMAKEIYYGKTPEPLFLIHKEEAILKFPELVKTISKTHDFEIAPLDLNNPDYSTLSIRPIFRKSKGDVTFIFDNGESLKLKIKTVSKEIPNKTDQVYVFKSKEELINPKKSKVNISALDLMKAMLRRDSVVGYKTKAHADKYLKIGDDLVCKLLKTYEGDRYTGYIFKISNKSKTSSAQIDLTQIKLGTPNTAILGQIDKRLIPKRSHADSYTYLRIVTKVNSFHKDLLLPFDYVEEANQ